MSELSPESKRSIKLLAGRLQSEASSGKKLDGAYVRRTLSSIFFQGKSLNESVVFILFACVSERYHLACMTDLEFLDR
jgi:hypothetical protein